MIYQKVVKDRCFSFVVQVFDTSMTIYLLFMIPSQNDVAQAKFYCSQIMRTENKLYNNLKVSMLAFY